MAFAFGNTKFSFTALTDENYFNCAFRATSILKAQGLYKYVKKKKKYRHNRGKQTEKI